MQQLVLDIVPPSPPRFDNLVTSLNAELIQACTSLANFHADESLLYVWGATGSGKSHLLQACVHLAQAQGKTAGYFNSVEFASCDALTFDFIAIDNVELLDADSQIKLFNLINQVRDGDGRLISAGNVAPMQLPLRVDLTTRLGWGLIYQMHSLSDTDKLAALGKHAESRGFKLDAGVADYLLRHWRRDLPSLMAALDSLDQFSLQTQRPITLPLLKQVLGTSTDLT